MGTLQLIPIFGFLWCVYFVTRNLRTAAPTAIDRVGLVVSLPIVFLTCTYYGLMAMLFVPLATMAIWTWRRSDLARFAVVAAGLALSFVIVAPILLTQKAYLDLNGATRSLETIRNNSALLPFYLNWVEGSLLHGWILGRTAFPGLHLYPGIGLLGLAAIGFIGRSSLDLKSERSLKGYCVVAVVAAFGLSLGLNVEVGGWRPYRVLVESVPGFDILRSPYRFAVFVQIHLALLAGWGIARIGSRAAAVAVTAIVLLELVAIPLPLKSLATTSEPAAWQEWLAARDQPRIVLLPFPASPTVADYEQTVAWMLAQRGWGGDMVNGYSGFFPPDYTALRDLMLSFPSLAAMEALRERGVEYVVVHHSLPGSPSPESVASVARQDFVDVGEGVAIYRILENE